MMLISTYIMPFLLQVVCKKVFASWYCRSLWLCFHLGWRSGSRTLQWWKVSLFLSFWWLVFLVKSSWYMVFIMVPPMWLPGTSHWLRNMVWRSLNLVLNPIMDWHGRWRKGEVTEKFTRGLSFSSVTLAPIWSYLLVSWSGISVSCVENWL